ncbi:transcriptional regulator, MarR family [Desulfosarcina variabilis str. Montpellier]|uniref:MarR family winged helix-turn-helix transcriptional regulator n=1 Tax=Desulfosarcina variabilis TaxID=2300 RepID=UPI003AFAAD76
MTQTANILHHCLYFTANTLTRVISRMADEEFRPTGLSPSHAFLMMLVNDRPGIGQKELCGQLHLAPSTVTRFIDAMVHKGYLTRQTDGKLSRVYATDAGQALQADIANAWARLHHRYAKILGLKYGDALTAMIDDASLKLSEAE